MTWNRPDDTGWIRLPAPLEPSAPGPSASRLAIAVLPAAAALVVLRRRARRRAGRNAWRYRTQGEISAENRRVVDAHDALDREHSAYLLLPDDRL